MVDGDQGRSARPHTGRRRNERARRAVLDATRQLLYTRPFREVTIDRIAAEAHVGKQTLYRWWASRAEIMLEVLTEESMAIASRQPLGVPLLDRLGLFLLDTIRAITGDNDQPGAGPALRGLMAEALADPGMQARFRDGFTAARRHDLSDLIAGAVDRAELPADADIDLLVDMAFGAIWYRLLLEHGPLDEALATDLARALVAAASIPSRDT
jgi:AcrR family transcriptional regulator